MPRLKPNPIRPDFRGAPGKGAWRKPRGMGQAGGANYLTPAQIQYYAQAAGFSGADLATAVAVALAESGGNASVYNAETAAKGGTPQGQGSYGLWQIYLKDHPEYAGWNLFDPATNAAAAFGIYSASGGTFTQWATFNSGAYQQFSAAASSATAPPITIDASTGQVVDDSTDVSALPTIDSSGVITPPASSGLDLNSLILFGSIAVAGWLLVDLLEL